MEQNVIAVIWDFDKTLIPGYMQEPIFQKYGVDETQFWKEVNDLPAQYKKRGIKVNKDTVYLNHMLTCVQQKIFAGLSNKILYELGEKLTFYAGVPEIFQDLKDVVEGDDKYRNFSIQVENYIVSTGLTEMIKGSKIKDYVEGIWGCEFIERPIRSNLDIKIDEMEAEQEIGQVGYIIDNTSKTRAIFEINKGTNKFEIDVNSKMGQEKRRVPFENMIYIADGPSDIPVFSILKQYGGKTFAIYPDEDKRAFNQVNRLIKDGRIDMYAIADYSKNTTAHMWLTETVREIADRIYQTYMDQLREAAGEVPQHLI